MHHLLCFTGQEEINLAVSVNKLVTEGVCFAVDVKSKDEKYIKQKLVLKEEDLEEKFIRSTGKGGYVTNDFHVVNCLSN